MRIAVLGAGRGSAELIDFLQREGRAEEIVILDDRRAELTQPILGVAVTGVLADARALASDGWKIALGIANAKSIAIRRDVMNRFAIPEEAWLTFVDSRASVSSNALIGSGSIVYPGACVAVGASAGRGCALYYNSVLHHDSQLGDGTVLTAGALVAGNVTIGSGCYIGIGAAIRDGVTIGDNVLVGMGAVVTRDVAAGSIVAGVPARVRR